MVAITGLLDTDILVDLLRHHQPAYAWIAQQSALGVATVVWIEILQGAQNRAAQQAALDDTLDSAFAPRVGNITRLCIPGPGDAQSFPDEYTLPARVHS